MGELSLACPDEGVWAYVGWGGSAVGGRAVVWLALCYVLILRARAVRG